MKVYCSSDQLELALMNLLKNSLRAAQSGLTTHIFLTLEEKDNRALLKIWDTGPKISEETLDAIREKTRGRTTIQKGGLGLGLLSFRE